MFVCRRAGIVRSRSYVLQRFFSTFPSGPPGVGLLVLRIASGSLAITQGVESFPQYRSRGEIPFAVIETGAGLLLAAGFLTPIVSVTLAVINLSVALSWITHPPDTYFAPHFLFIAAVEAGIALLGPGALSVDARLFGRHRIIIPPPRK